MPDIDSFSRPFHGLRQEESSYPSDKSLGYVRLKARVVGEVKVLFRHTLSGL
jgi:hypothetical protein